MVVYFYGKCCGWDNNCVRPVYPHNLFYFHPYAIPLKITRIPKYGDGGINKEGYTSMNYISADHYTALSGLREFRLYRNTELHSVLRYYTPSGLMQEEFGDGGYCGKLFIFYLSSNQDDDVNS